MAEAKRDANYITSLLAVSNVDGVTPVVLYADPTTHRLLVSATAGTLNDLSDVVITSAAQGDILYNNGTNWVNLAAGTSGKFLKTQGAGANPLWDTPAGGTIDGSGTANEIAYWVDTDTLGTLAVATYPSLTELSYVKGVTSAVQTQLNAKQASLGFTAENVANKSTDTALGTSDTLYPSQKAVKTYADSLVTGLLDYRGAYDASVNTFPASGGSGTAGAVLKGDMWILSVAGALGGVAVQIGDSVIANVDTPGQTAGNWNILNSNISYVPEDVANKVTSISGASTDTQYPSAKLVYDQLALKAALAGSTGQVFSVSSLEVGNADTTLSRVSAGVIAVEGVTIPTISSTSTLTNKRVQPRILSAASYTTDTGTSLNLDNLDVFIVTAQAGALLFNSPGGTLAQGEKLIIRIKDNGTARALTWNAVFRAMGTALPSTTVLSKTLYLGFFYNSTDTKWDLVASAQEV